MQAADDRHGAAAFDRARALLAVLAADGRLLHVNRPVDAADALIDRAAIGRPLWLAEGWPTAALEDAVRRAAAGESVLREIEVCCRDGARRWVELGVGPLAPGLLLAEVHDVTAWKLRELLALRTDSQYRAVVDTQTEIISRLRPDGTLVFVNDAYCQFVGRDRDALLGRRWQLVAHADDVPYIERELARMSAANPIVVIENRVLDGEGRLRWMEFVNRGFHDGDGALVEIQSIGRDISLRKQGEAEREAAAERFQTWQRLESLGALASSVASDFNDLHTSVMIHAMLARRDLPPGCPAAGCLDEIEAAAGRAARICRRMLDYTGAGSTAPRPLDLGAVVAETVPLLRSSLPGCALELVADPDLPLIAGDPSQLQQIVFHLVVNAFQALREPNGRVTITTRAAHLERADLRYYLLGAESEPGEYTALTVHDDGCGMTREVLARVFDPFYSTRADGRGLGLSATLGLVRAHRGAIRIDSEPGRGTRVEVVLPRVRPVPGAFAEASRAPCQAVALLLDSDDAVRSGLARVLASLGYAVVEARSGREALALCRADDRPISVLLLDPRAPDIDADLLRGLRALQPGAAAVVMTGHSDTAAALSGCTIDGRLQKPFRPRELQALLTELGRPPSAS